MEPQQDPPPPKQAQQPQPQPQQGGEQDSSTGSSSKSSFLCRQTSTRWTPTTDQIRILKDLYYNNGVRSPSAEQIQRISARLRQYGKIEGKNVFYWFQNHKARERQKRRFNADMAAMQQQQQQQQRTSTNTNTTCLGVATWKPSDLQLDSPNVPNKYLSITPGVSTPSSPCSPGVLGVGQMGSMGYGPILMEKSFRDCSLSTNCSGVGSSISNNLGWVGVDPSYPSYLDRSKTIQFIKEEASVIETLPLFPMHGDNLVGFYNGYSTPDPSGYNTTTWYRCESENIGTHHQHHQHHHASLELSLNSYNSGLSQNLGD
ncbi:hypothetical protein GIB67_003873 [Kingdonia uniflora]|uniref:Homeobox domain-containing protein n=1 Tax=Kingdonia uniflora TaxID=39325 RepID=A0A7J7LJV2_9MAGN|nr:hypothetical protein GIB67_003873 [Kingdonia uniflora]